MALAGLSFGTISPAVVGGPWSLQGGVDHRSDLLGAQANVITHQESPGQGRDLSRYEYPPSAGALLSTAAASLGRSRNASASQRIRPGTAERTRRPSRLS